MQRVEDEYKSARVLRFQRNVFAAFAIAALASIGVALPRKIDSYHELERVNSRLTELQTTIVLTQLHIGEIQEQITKAEQEIRKLQQQ
jgi:hypothetical protein